MKKQILSLLAVVLFASNSHAACRYSNTVETPTTHLANNNARTGLVWLSNTSKHPITLNIKVYDDSGSDVTSSVVSGGGSMSLNPKGSGYFTLLGNGVARTTFGELTWTSQECLRKPMIGTVETLYQAGSSRYGSMANPINSGRPF